MASAACPLSPTRLRTRSLAVVAAVATTAVLVPAIPVDTVSLATASRQNVALLATQAAIMMNGTFTPDVTPEFAASVMDNYINPVVGPGYTAVPLRTPESLWPISGLSTLTYNESTRVGYQILDAEYREIVAQNTADGAPRTPMLVFGYSQSAFISSVFDQTLGTEIDNGKPVPPTTFFLVGNTNVPNGGLMSRFNGLGLTPWTPLVFAPTDTGSLTYDLFRQYDPFADFPAYPLNALAVVNSLMGYLLHFTLPVSGAPDWLTPVIGILNKLITPISLNPASPNYVKPVVSQYQDTIYQFVPTAKLPILDPLRWVGLSALADDLDPVVRPLVEAGYDRSTSFGVPTPAKFGLGPNLDAALRQSWQALLHLLDPANPAPSAAVARPAAAAVESSPPAMDPAVTSVANPHDVLSESARPVVGAPAPTVIPVPDEPTVPESGAPDRVVALDIPSGNLPGAEVPPAAERPARHSASRGGDSGARPQETRHSRR